ncbi:MAG: Holliday junction resolvase RuvX [Rubricoccaceae bacterium]
MTDSHPRIVAVDYGSRRVGLAISDPLQMFAQPLDTLPPAASIERLVAVHTTQSLEAIVVGWPLTESGEEAEAIARVRPYIGRLKKALPDVRIETQDERYSSRRAVDGLVQAGVGKKGRRDKARIDAAAAAVILQDYLDERG